VLLVEWIFSAYVKRYLQRFHDLLLVLVADFVAFQSLGVPLEVSLKTGLTSNLSDPNGNVLIR
jgi:hypothetical protein